MAKYYSATGTDGWTMLFRTKDASEVLAAEYGVSKEVAKRRLENGMGNSNGIEFSKNGKLPKTAGYGMPLIKMLEVTEITKEDFGAVEKISGCNNYRFIKGSA